MIVSCPRCHKQYRLDVSRLNYALLPDNSGLGVQLACSNCNEQWWELKKESINANQQELRAAVPEQPFKNLTDISLLYQRQSGNYAYQSANSTSATSFGSNFSARAEDQMFSTLPQPQKHANSQRSRWKNLAKITFWSIAILGTAVAINFAAIKFNHATNFLTENSGSELHTNPGEVVIDGIQFDIKPVNDKLQKVIVAGNVKNPGPFAIPLHNIQITVSGSCSDGQTPNDQGLCEIRTWQYKWKQDLIQPGEHLTFKGSANVPANLQVEQVHVDAATN